jgi:hypothetical protein
MVLHPASDSTTKAADTSKLVRNERGERIENMGAVYMWVIFVEASAAAFVFVFIVWWTMFSGRKAEPPPEQEEADGQSGASDPAKD